MLTISIEAHLPNTTWCPFNQSHGHVQMKNYEPFVFGPALAIETAPIACLILKFSSSNLAP